MIGRLVNRPEEEARPDRIAALIRLGALPVAFAAERLVDHPGQYDELFDPLLAVAAAYALGTLVLSTRPGLSQRVPAAAFAIVDLTLLCALVFTSGGPFSELRYAFFAVPVLAALLMSERLTAVAALAATIAYVAIALLHPVTDERPDATDFEFVQAGYMLWAGAAATALAHLLRRRTERIDELARSRGRLVAQALGAEDRERRRLAEALHDEALQNLLAVRQELGRNGSRTPDLDLARLGVDRTVEQLRHAVFDLHPYLLEQAGLSAAVGAVAEQQGHRAGFEASVAVADDAVGVEDQLLFSLARELLTNCAKHARARHVEVTIRREGGEIILDVADDGEGFDPDKLARTTLTGHIGLASCSERVAAIGGRFAIENREGGGTRAYAALPVRVPAAQV